MYLVKHLILLLLLTGCFTNIDHLERDILFCQFGYLHGLDSIPNHSRLPQEDRKKLVEKAENFCTVEILRIYRESTNE